MADKKSSKDDEYGVLLYYKYTQIHDLNDLFTFYDSNCKSLSLLGRVRLAPHGVNVTVGGKLSALEEHIAAVSKNHLFEGTDFKLATCSKPIKDRVAEECGFTTLCIRIVKELVTFSSNPLLKSPEISNTGKHLSALEFHSVLQSPENFSSTDASKRLVLLDARNLYETRIGKFSAPNVETLDPEIRQYSDLPSWIDNHSEELRGNTILMYCTGGIRCEMASAYIKSKGEGFENVFQLYGGIQRYLEQFPYGGFFKGKNFVFDHRVSVGSSDPNVLGNCLICNLSFDDYSSRSRCTYCRMLVLVCHSCQGKSSQSSLYVCELCQKHGKLVESVPVTGTNASKKLRILCLHGFRQNASSFKGRTASFAKKLKNMAEFVYIDAPHELQFIYQSCSDDKKVNEMSMKSPPRSGCNRKFAWFIDAKNGGKISADWEVAHKPFDSLQYKQQIEGFDKSLEYLKKIVSQNGSFDGILGFSQGAAMAAAIAAQKGSLKGEIDFRFVILSSGFSANLAEYEQNSINCPSIHIFGSDHGKDRQIACDASRELASLFEEGCSIVVEHDCGHIIPTRSPYIDTIKDFLRQFL